MRPASPRGSVQPITMCCGPHPAPPYLPEGYLKVLQRPLSRYRCVPDRVRRVCGAMIEVYNVTVYVATVEMSLAGFMVALKPLPPTT
jgi:hypothetical protein